MKFKTARIHFLGDVIAAPYEKLPLAKVIVTVDVAPSDSEEEEGREMKNRAATPPLFCSCFVFFSCLLFFVLPPPPPPHYVNA